MSSGVAFCLGIIFSVFCFVLGFIMFRWISSRQLRRFLKENKKSK